MGTLYARVGSTWVPISGSNDEVFIGPDDPIGNNPMTELWYDTDALGAVSQPTYGLDASKPTNPGQPMLYFSTDTKRSWQWDGTKWVLVGGSMPRFRMTGASASLPTATAVSVSWGTEAYDADNVHGTGAKVTIPATLAGVWEMGYTIDFANAATGNKDSWIAKNGAAASGNYYGYQSIAANQVISNGTTQLVLNVGDTAEVQVYQNSGGTTSVGATGAADFWGRYVGPI